jgi:iron complex transport system substrate-binding protein
MNFVDQLNNTISLKDSPKRIISLVPSQTELLFDLGLENEVVGITKFCIHPTNWFKTKTRVGGTKTIDIDKVKSLQPDLIIGNKEENSLSDIEQLNKIAPVWMSDIYNLDDAYAMIQSIGKICDRKEKARKLVADIQQNFSKSNFKPLSKNVIYLIWNDPLMAVGNTTFIHSIITELGLTNFYENESRYPLCIQNVEKQPDYIFLSSEPFPFKEEHKNDLQKQFPKSKIIFVDGEYFSWYGSRLLKLPEYLEKLHTQL